MVKRAAHSVTNSSVSPALCWLIVLLPFGLFYWMAPFVAGLTISMDYPLHPITEQIELMFSLKTGSFPLYAPGYHLGHSSSALTLGQFYHPISHIASMLPGYWGGKALEWNTFLRLLSLGLTQLALFLFLRRISLKTVFAFVISFITVYNLRTLEAFRYGASLEAFTAHLLLCAMVGRYYISPSRWLGPLSITGVTYMLACSGHPPMMFYGFIAAGLFMVVLPFIIPSIMNEREPDMKEVFRFWAKTASFVVLGVLLSSVYVVPFYFEFVRSNVSYSQSGGLVGAGLEAPETLAGALNNFFLPFFADLLGSFGGSSLIIMALLLPLLLFFRVRVPRALWLLWGVIIYVLLHILGPGTPVYLWVYEHVPFVSSLGGVGRIALIAPSVLMVVMAWAVSAKAFDLRLMGRSMKVSPALILASAALVLTPAYLGSIFLLKPGTGDFTPHIVRGIPSWIEMFSVGLGLLSLALLAFYSSSSRRLLGVLLAAAVVFQTGLILKYGVWVEEKKDKPTFEEMGAIKEADLDYSFHDCPNTQHRVVIGHLSSSFMEPFKGRIFTQVIPVADQEEAYSRMRTEWLPQQVFVEGIEGARAAELSEGARDMREGTVELVYSSYNRLRFRVVSGSPSFFGLSYPYTGHWRAWVNGGEVPVYRGNGAAHAMEIPEGESVVEFRYWSDAFLLGVIISCLTFMVAGVYISFKALKGPSRILCVILSVLIGFGAVILWYDSLYAGDDLGTEYKWSYTPPAVPLNIAYGKKTSGYLLPSNSFLHWHSSNAVDGDTSPGSGLPLSIADDKVVVVDLNRVEEIGAVVLYGEISAQPEIYTSLDGAEWKQAVHAGGASPLRVVFREGLSARYIRIKAAEPKLYLDEIEVYRHGS